MYIIICGVAVGFVLDLLLGDPTWLPHPIVAIGKLIGALEKRLIKKQKKVRAGGLMVLIVCFLSFTLPIAILVGAYFISAWLAFAINAWMCYRIFATKCLAQAANFVKKEMEKSTQRAEKPLGESSEGILLNCLRTELLRRRLRQLLKIRRTA